MHINADKVPIKKMYFKSGSKGLEPEGKYSGLYGYFLIINWSSKIANTCLLYGSLSPCCQNIEF